MNRLFIPIISVVFIFIRQYCFAQEESPVHLIFSVERSSPRDVIFNVRASIQKNVKLYSINPLSDNGISSSIAFDSSLANLIIESQQEKIPFITEKDSKLRSIVKFNLDSALWQQKLKIASSDSMLLKGRVSYMYKKGDQYIAGEEKFKVFVHKGNPSQVQEGKIEPRSRWWIFLAAFGGGLLALLTPCVYSMIPITVGFFTKRSRTRSKGISNSIFYAFSIVMIFTVLGFLVTLIFGPAALNNLATNWIANLVFFFLFVTFGFSFLGAFEISLPTSWTNISDSHANAQNSGGIFFMALTLVIASFSCTGPIIGNLLVLASGGSYFGPLIGMLGFSIALAFPFALFAFFPSKLNVLGIAGGWLNAVKVTLGFLELALALKFLSNADLSKGWRLLDREIFICIWVIIFFLLGIYLLGKIKFHHDDELPKNDFGIPYVAVSRLAFAVISLSFAIYLIPGLWGAPLKAVSAFVPPMGTQDFSFGDQPSTVNYQLSTPIKYFDRMKIYEPDVVKKFGMVTYFDYDEALAISRKLHKPLMIGFTGINCVNCRKMEGQVWSEPEVMKRLKEDFVIASLYVDAQNVDLQENEIYYSKSMSKKITTLGDKNADLQVSKYGSNAQPLYFFLDAKEQKLIESGYGYDPNISKFLALLDSVKMNFSNGQ